MKIKPLVWGENIFGNISSSSIVGSYTLLPCKGNGIFNAFLEYYEKVANEVSAMTAKELCQQHYESKILEVIEDQ